jgi:hypothetical protein
MLAPIPASGLLDPEELRLGDFIALAPEDENGPFFEVHSMHIDVFNGNRHVIIVDNALADSLAPLPVHVYVAAGDKVRVALADPRAQP